MVNIFVSDRDPLVSARALDSNRIGRMVYESFDLLSSTIKRTPKLNKKYGELVYSPPQHHLMHPAATWVLQDKRHFNWLLTHATELNQLCKHRYKHDIDHLSYFKHYEVMEEILPKLKKTYSGKIVFEGFFNYNQFGYKKQKHRKGDVVLKPSVDIFTRYKLSLVHKWLYLDVREPNWAQDNPPDWAFDIKYRKWLRKHFGKPVNRPKQLEM